MDEVTLRDYFAAKAMVAVAHTAFEQSDMYATEADLLAQIAKSSYELADAMLCARDDLTEGNN